MKKKILVFSVALFFIASLFSVAPSKAAGSGINPYGLAMEVMGGIKTLLMLTHSEKKNDTGTGENPVTFNQKEMVKKQALKGNILSFGEMITRESINQNSVAFAFNATKNSTQTIAIIIFTKTDQENLLQCIRILFDDLNEFKSFLNESNGSFKETVRLAALRTVKVDIGPVDPDQPQQLQTVQAQPNPQPAPEPSDTNAQPVSLPISTSTEESININ